MMNEAWKMVPGFSAYEASTLGRVRKGQKLIAANVGSHGYLMVNMKSDEGVRSANLLHVVIATTYIGPRPGRLDCCHNDGDPYNVASGNLRWDTRKNNIADQKKHGSFGWHGKKKLRLEDLPAIRMRVESGEKMAVIALDYGVSKTAIGAVTRGASWSAETGIAKGCNNSRVRARGSKINGVLTDEKVKQIVARLDAGEKQTEIAKDFNVRPQTISNINVGLSWAWLTGRIE